MKSGTNACGGSRAGAKTAPRIGICDGRIGSIDGRIENRRGRIEHRAHTPHLTRRATGLVDVPMRLRPGGWTRRCARDYVNGCAVAQATGLSNGPMHPRMRDGTCRSARDRAVGCAFAGWLDAPMRRGRMRRCGAAGRADAQPGERQTARNAGTRTTARSPCRREW